MDELREYFTNLLLTTERIPGKTPRPHMEIFDMRKFIETSLARLDSESPRLRRLAELNLKALKNILEK
jgi:hypothetical protein